MQIDHKFLKEHVTAYHYGHVWYPKRGEMSKVEGGPFATKEECNKARDRALKAFGYRPPRWWQYWRWDEHPLF